MEWIAIPVLCLLSAALVFHLGREIVRFARARGWLWCLLVGGFAVLASPAGQSRSVSVSDFRLRYPTHNSLAAHIRDGWCVTCRHTPTFTPPAFEDLKVLYIPGRVGKAGCELARRRPKVMDTVTVDGKPGTVSAVDYIPGAWHAVIHVFCGYPIDMGRSGCGCYDAEGGLLGVLSRSRGMTLDICSLRLRSPI